MSRFLLFANLILAAVVALFVNYWRIETAAAHRRAESLVRMAVVRLPEPPPQIEASPSPRNARSSGADAVQRFVFSRDRTPNVIERVPESNTPVPALPAVYGTLNLGESPTILLGFSSGAQHAYSVGEQVGTFRLVRFNSASVTFEWKGQEITRSVQDLAARQESALNREPLEAIVASIPTPPATPKGNAVGPQMGPALSDTEHACMNGDQQPPGTITVDGFRKVVTKMPFGEVCRWIK